MLQQHLAQVDQQATTTTTTAATATTAVSAKAVGQSSSRTSRSSSSRAQQRATLTTKLLHHQSKLEQALTGASAPAEAAYRDTGQSLAAGIESGGGAALMSNFAALATGSRHLTSSASLRTDSGEQQCDFRFDLLFSFSFANIQRISNLLTKTC